MYALESPFSCSQSRKTMSNSLNAIQQSRAMDEMILKIANDSIDKSQDDPQTKE
jgi:hypothetical protein